MKSDTEVVTMADITQAAVKMGLSQWQRQWESSETGRTLFRYKPKVTDWSQIDYPNTISYRNIAVVDKTRTVTDWSRTTIKPRTKVQNTDQSTEHGLTDYCSRTDLTKQGPSRTTSVTEPGWVVTWFLLGYTVGMIEYTVRTFWSNVGRFLYVFSSIPRKLYTIFQPIFSPIKRYQDSIFKLLTLSTNSVTNVVRTAYFQIQARSSPLKILWQSLYSK